MSSAPRKPRAGVPHAENRQSRPLDDREKLSLLFALARAPAGRATQREVAATLSISKVDARQRLRATVADGLVEEAIDDSRSAPGRRVFWLTDPAGTAELARLQRRARRAP